MLSLGSLAFLQPLFLIGLATLPILWWLLRATPPAPRRERFPAVRVLLGLPDKEKTPQRTPWWLLLLRIAAAALLLLAFAQPILNPQERLAGEGPLLLALDTGWGAADDWAERRALALDLLAQAEQAERPTAVVALADPRAGTPEAPAQIELLPASLQAEILAALDPSPWRPDPARWTPAITAFLATPEAAGAEVLWLHDGVDHPGGEALTELLAAAASPALRLIGPERPAVALAPPSFRDGALVARAVRVETDGPRAVTVRAIGGGAAALDDDGEAEAAADAAAFDPTAAPAERRLSQTVLRFAPGETEAEAEIALPQPLLNALGRLELASARHAGAVTLMDDRFRRKTVAVVSGERVSAAQPLLSSAHYISAALQPVALTRDASLAEALGLPERDARGRAAGVVASDGDEPASWADIIILADVGSFDAEIEAALIAWVENGGLLVRFAGPQLAAQTAERSEIGGRLDRGAPGAEDPLLPVRLRAGGRELGGALSWSTPQPLRAFPEASPFAGLRARPDVTVSRQVLAEPGPELADRVWAALADGTPLVTARPLGAGQVALFHISGRPDWSTLPLSGLFVDMMGRLAASATAAAGEAALAEDSAAAASWTPVRLLDGYGALAAAGGDAAALSSEQLRAGVGPGVAPGFYEADTDAGRAGRALNAYDGDAAYAARPAAPLGVSSERLGGETETVLKPWLLGLAMLLLTIDVLAAMALAGRLRGGGMGGRRAAALAVAGLSGALLAAGAGLSIGGGGAAWAQTAPSVEAPTEPSGALERIDPAQQRAALETVIAYVVTGDERVDRVSAAGLEGLSQTLRSRTSIEPGEPARVNLEEDDIAVYALLYWPMTRAQPDLSDAAVRKLNQFMRTGGMLVIDTRDQHRTVGRGPGPNAQHLRRLAGLLDLPPLEQASDRHVLTRTFYLLDAFPGRWSGGGVWVEAGSGGESALREGGSSGAANDGVSPVVIGGNDWAGAWAVDERGQPLLPMGRGGPEQREQALRFGVNAAMYAYTGNYKSDQVHIPALLERLGN